MIDINYVNDLKKQQILNLQIFQLCEAGKRLLVYEIDIVPLQIAAEENMDIF
jgi:hypothetical protein